MVNEECIYCGHICYSWEAECDVCGKDNPNHIREEKYDDGSSLRDSFLDEDEDED